MAVIGILVTVVIGLLFYVVRCRCKLAYGLVARFNQFERI